MNKKQYLEFIPLTIFMISGICTFLKVPYSPLAMALSGFLLGCLYFYAAFWLFADYNLPAVTRIIIGLLLSIAVFGCFFSLFKWSLGGLYSFVSCIGLVVIAVISIFNRKNPGYKQLLYRCIFYIAIVLIINAINFFVRGISFVLI